MKHYLHRDENAIYYECGYSCDNAIYLRLGDEAYFITDGRYTIDAKEHVKGAEVITTTDLAKEAAKRIKMAKIKKITIDPKEWNCYLFEQLRKEVDCTFVPVVSLSHKKRIIKRDDEIALLGKAARKGAKAFEKFVGYIQEKGVGKEDYTLTYKAKEYLSFKGHYALSFDPIVAIGANAAKPHATPQGDTLHRGDLLLIDAGLKYKRYCSDRTRTLFIGKNLRVDTSQCFKGKKMQKIYDTVLKAHDKALAKAKSGMRAKKIDAIAREVIDKAGFGKYFVHSTGHGVGLDIHEMPYISAKSDTVIEDGMVFTIEPGIYMPGEFGVRIEDMVVMRNGRAEVLGLG